MGKEKIMPNQIKKWTSNISSYEFGRVVECSKFKKPFYQKNNHSFLM